METRPRKTMFVRSMYIMAILAIALTATGVASAQESEPTPFIAVSLTQHWFWANNFTPEKTVTFYVYDNQGDENAILQFSRNTDEFGNVTIEGWEHLWNPEPGDFIVATDESITKELVLEYLTLDVFDYEHDYLSGEAAFSGRSVDIGVGNEIGEQWVNVTAGENSRWEADFTLPDHVFNITENSWAGAHVNDEDGDVTAAHNSGPPEPPAWFTAFPHQELVEGWDWPLNSLIHLTIDDPNTDAFPDYWQDENVIQTPWGSGQLWVWFEFPGAYDMKPGDIVTLTDGVTERTHVVRNLSITEANAKHNTVRGTSDGNENISLWSWEGGWLQETANRSGVWSADFDDIGFDLIPGYHVRAEVWDEGGNDTAVDWYVHPSYTGHWRAIDSYDQSDMQLTISGGGNNQYQLIWTDDSWSDCEGRNSVGYGIGRLVPDVLIVDWVIKCQGTVVWQGQFDYWLDLETGELWDGANTWYMVGNQ